MTALKDIEGIGPSLASKLKRAGVGSVQQLLRKGCSAAGRRAIAEAAGIDSGRVLRFVNHADLMRIRGVGGEYSELLEAAGVDSVPELAQRSVTNLNERMRQINAQRRLVRALPSEGRVADWVKQARALPRMVSH